jgi:hypothetical protein
VTTTGNGLKDVPWMNLTAPTLTTNTTTSVTVSWTIPSSPTILDKGNAASLGNYLLDASVVGSGTWSNLASYASATTFTGAIPTVFAYNT